MDTRPTTETSQTFEFQELTPKDSDAIVPLANKMRPDISAETMRTYQAEML